MPCFRPPFPRNCISAVLVGSSPQTKKWGWSPSNTERVSTAPNPSSSQAQASTDGSLMVHPGLSWAFLVHPGPAASQSRWEQHSGWTPRLTRVPAWGQCDSRKAFGDCTRHLGMSRGGTKGREWKVVHENSVPQTPLCVKGSEQQEQGRGIPELLFLSVRN